MSVSKQTVLETLYTFKTLQDEEITNKLSTLGLSGITGDTSSVNIDTTATLDTVRLDTPGAMWYSIENEGAVLKLRTGSEIYSYFPDECIVAPVALDTPLNDCSWEQISTISQAGLADTYFDIGDTKEITLNGNIGDYLTLTNETLCVFILHFNYPMNGAADNNIVFGGFKSTNGTDIALTDSKLSTAGNVYTQDGSICFNMNHKGRVNYGGWKGCDLRYDILGATSTPPSQYNQSKNSSNVGYNATGTEITSPKANTVLAALPADFRNVLRYWRRWIDAVGNGSKTDANVQETVDAVTLLAEFEVFGTQDASNTCEQNHQTYLAYYAAGNSTAKSHTWWLATPSTINYNQSFRCANSSATTNYAFYPLGLAPAFLV